MEQKKIIKIVYKDQKFKQALSEDLKSFKNLKSAIAQKLNQKNNSTLQDQDLQCLDNSDYEYDDEELLQDYLNHNDIVQIKEKPQQNNAVKLSDNEQAYQSDQKTEESAPAEAIVVIYDVSGSMGCRFYGDKDLSRIGATNAFFSAFADKTMAFEFNHQLALYCFDSQIQMKCDFTTNYQQFINMVDSCSPGSATRLYDSIQVAIAKLLEAKQKYPDIVLRIIAMTDGEDNQSTSQPLELAKSIVLNKITMDSFVVSDSCIGLKQITHASGGKCYRPQDLVQGLQLFEIETILSTKSRSQEERKTEITPEFFENLKQQPFDMEGMSIEKPKEMQKAVESAQQIVQKMKKQEQSGQKFQGGASQKRIYKELADITQSPAPLIKFFPTADDITSWKVVLIGPENSLYSQGIFQLYVKFPADYPFKPPKVTFLTKIYHCNVSSQGSLCLDILKDQWSPALTIQKVMLGILSLLRDPNPNDALNSDVASEMLDKDLKHQFADKVKDHIQKHASPCIEELMTDIMGNNVDSTSQEYNDKKIEMLEWIQESKEIQKQPPQQQQVNQGEYKGKAKKCA